MSVYHPDENVTPKNPPSSDSATIDRLAAAIARRHMSPAELQEQRISFAFGQIACSRGMSAAEAAQLRDQIAARIEGEME